MIYKSKITPKGNSSYSFISKKEAEINANKLDKNNCHNCLNCHNCYNCSNCFDCSFCTDCNICSYCINSNNCSCCSICYNCINCSNKTKFINNHRLI